MVLGGCLIKREHGALVVALVPEQIVARHSSCFFVAIPLGQQVRTNFAQLVGLEVLQLMHLVPISALVEELATAESRTSQQAIVVLRLHALYTRHA